MKNNKGFTLIELMIAIAIIGILALVLIPKVGGMKTTAKLAGIDTNMRIAVGIVESVINDYTTSSGDLTALESAIASRLPTDLANPLTSNKGTITPAATVPTTGLPYVILTSDNTGAPSATTDTDLKGAILIGAYDNGGTLTVELIPFDQDGVAMAAAKRKTVTK